LRDIADDFLKQACSIAYGDTTKDIDISEVWRSLNIDDQSEDIPPEIIVNTVQMLKDRDFIEEGDNYDQIKVTRNGINHVIAMPGESANHYGVVSIQEVNTLYPNILEFICYKTADRGDGISTTEIKKEKLNPYSFGVLNQIIDFLIEKNLVCEVVEGNPFGSTKEEIVIKPTLKGKDEVKRLKTNILQPI
jgi:hypothetical protein